MRFVTILALASTSFAASASKSPDGACSIIPSAAILKVFGEPVTNTKPAPQTPGELTYSQCFYSLPTFTNSISVSLASPAAAHSHAARDLWRRLFHGEATDEAREAAGKSEEAEAATKASPVEHLGDEAFWVQSFVGNLYVLKGDSFLRISIGGKFTNEERQKRARILALAALSNLKARH